MERRPPKRRAAADASITHSTQVRAHAAVDQAPESRGHRLCVGGATKPALGAPGRGAAGVAGLALFAAASALLSPSVVPEGGEYKGLGIGQDGIVRVGLPAGGEVLVPGAPFQHENGYLGMWNWEKQGTPVPKDQTPEAQKALRAAFEAERKKFDVEAQQQGFSSAEVRGRRLYFCRRRRRPPSYTGARHRRQRAHPRGEGGREGREGGREGGEGGGGREGGGGGQVRDAGETGLLRQHEGHRAAGDVRRRRAEEVDSPQKKVV